LFSAVISEHQQKMHDYICSGCKKYGISKNVRFLLGHPVHGMVAKPGFFWWNWTLDVRAATVDVQSEVWVGVYPIISRLEGLD